ncbi:family 43 glycosylhydrolase [Streptomyces sp. NPDC003016]
MLAALLLPAPAQAAVPASPAVSYTNPLVNQRADPHIFKHTDGYYYFTATVPEYDRIVLRRATTIQGLSTAPETVIWTKHATGDMGAHIWAPEIHFIDGKWYIYFAAGRADDVWKIRMYALESSAANPLTGGWTEKGRIATPMDSFALDATTFVVNGVRYLSWAQKDPAIDTNSNVYLAKMANPWTITGTPVRLAVPTYSWETVGHKVNEGPAVIQRGGKVFMSYSASATDSNYCLGLLTASATGNLLDPAAWKKSPAPVFTSNAATGQYGPGHNSFTTSEDGRSDVLVYHDRNYKDITGDPLNDPNRRTRVQKLYWNADGTPHFGIPVADGATPRRLSSANFPDHYIRHWEYRGKLEANVTHLADSQFRTVTGLAGSGTVSLESANFPGYYLRHRNGEIWVEKNDGTTAFKGSAGFYQRPGLADPAGVSYEAYTAPGQYVRHFDFLLHLQGAGTTLAKQDATFHQQ